MTPWHESKRVYFSLACAVQYRRTSKSQFLKRMKAVTLTHTQAYQNAAKSWVLSAHTVSLVWLFQQLLQHTHINQPRHRCHHAFSLILLSIHKLALDHTPAATVSNKLQTARMISQTNPTADLATTLICTCY